VVYTWRRQRIKYMEVKLQIIEIILQKIKLIKTEL